MLVVELQLLDLSDTMLMPVETNDGRSACLRRESQEQKEIIMWRPRKKRTAQ
jgi:hypothetical protein